MDTRGHDRHASQRVGPGTICVHSGLHLHRHIPDGHGRIQLIAVFCYIELFYKSLAAKGRGSLTVIISATI